MSETTTTATPATIPAGVRTNLEFKLKMLQSARDIVMRGRGLDDRFGGGGRYEAEAFQALDHESCVVAKKWVFDFQAKAAELGIPAEEVLRTIEELGGDASFTLSARAVSWLPEEVRRDHAL